MKDKKGKWCMAEGVLKRKSRKTHATYKKIKQWLIHKVDHQLKREKQVEKWNKVKKETLFIFAKTLSFPTHFLKKLKTNIRRIYVSIQRCLFHIIQINVLGWPLIDRHAKILSKGVLISLNKPIHIKTIIILHPIIINNNGIKYAKLWKSCNWYSNKKEIDGITRSFVNCFLSRPPVSCLPLVHR